MLRWRPGFGTDPADLIGDRSGLSCDLKKDITIRDIAVSMSNVAQLCELRAPWSSFDGANKLATCSEYLLPGITKLRNQHASVSILPLNVVQIAVDVSQWLFGDVNLVAGMLPCSRLLLYHPCCEKLVRSAPFIFLLPINIATAHRRHHPQPASPPMTRVTLTSR